MGLTLTGNFYMSKRRSSAPARESILTAPARPQPVSTASLPAWTPRKRFPSSRRSILSSALPATIRAAQRSAPNGLFSELSGVNSVVASLQLTARAHSSAYNQPTNVEWQGNDDRPGYHASWSFPKNGAQEDIFDTSSLSSAKEPLSTVSTQSRQTSKPVSSKYVHKRLALVR